MTGRHRSAPASPYRVLDLTGADGFLCGRLLADLGMDVIKVEPPSGDPGRRTGPLVENRSGSAVSLFWAAFNTSKRSITLNLESADGWALFRHLVKTADLVIESFPPGYLKRLGLGYSSLRRLNRRLIQISISPCGQSGPYAHYQSTDIVAMAMGGFLHTSGDTDRPPVRVSVPQAALHAGLQAAVGAMIALHHRARARTGQHVDVSTQESLVWTATPAATSSWDLNRETVTRSGAVRARVGTGNLFRMHWPCKEGFVSFGLQAGRMGGPIMYALAEWIESEGYDPGFLKTADWEAFDWANATQEELDAISEPLLRFFKDHTKNELFYGAMERRVILYPVYTLDEVLGVPQLKARDFWTSVEHAELGRALPHPGLWTRFSVSPLRQPGPPPHPGEHNEEVYQGELGYSRSELAFLQEMGAI